MCTALFSLTVVFATPIISAVIIHLLDSSLQSLFNPVFLNATLEWPAFGCVFPFW